MMCPTGPTWRLETIGDVVEPRLAAASDVRRRVPRTGGGVKARMNGSGAYQDISRTVAPAGC